MVDTGFAGALGGRRFFCCGLAEPRGVRQINVGEALVVRQDFVFGYADLTDRARLWGICVREGTVRPVVSSSMQHFSRVGCDE